VRKKQRKPSLNELFIIGRRENTIGRAADESTQTAPAAVNVPGAEKKDAADDEGLREEKKKKKKKKVEEDFIIVFKYGGKAYRCSEKEKTILERQVKTLDPSTFQMLLDDFQLEVYAVLDEPQAQAPQAQPAEPPQPESNPAEKSEDDEYAPRPHSELKPKISN
jgi:ribosomal protein L12E/L44/L45/RPP1/RPP2